MTLRNPRKCQDAIQRRLAVGIMLLALATASHAGDGMPNMDEARRLLNEGKAEQSAALLEPDLTNFAGNADYDFLLGLALLQSGQSGPALFAFERVLMTDPGNVDARLKAAQISSERGDAAYARELLAPLPGAQLNTKQQQEAAQIHTAIAQAAGQGPVSMRGYLLGGFGWDDNVTGGPDQNALAIPQLGTTPTSLGSAARDHDQLGFAEAGISLQKAIGENIWLTGEGSMRQGFNREREDMTEGYVNLDLGILKRSGREFFGAALLAQDYLLGNKTYRNSLGGRLSWLHSFDDRSTLTGYFQQLTFDHPDHPIDDATRRIVGVTRESTTAGDTGVLQFGAYGGREVAKDATKPHFSFHLWGISLGGSMVLSRKLLLSAGAIYESRRHDAVDALYWYTRHDTQRSVGVAADCRLNERWHFIPRYTYTRNASNTELYDYTRNTFMLQLRWDFDNENI